MFKTFLGVGFFNILAAAFGFFLNVIYGKTLSVSDYGDLYFLLSIVYILNYIIDGGISQSIVVFSSNYNNQFTPYGYIRFVFNRYSKYLIISSILSIGISSAIIYFNELLTFQNFVLLFISGILTSVTKVFISFFQGEKNWIKFNFSNISLNFLRLAPLLIILLLNKSPGIGEITWILILSSLIQFILVAYLLFTNKRELQGIKPPSVNYSDTIKKDFSKHFYSLLGITLVTVVASRLDVLITKQFLSSEELGLYSMGSSLALIFPVMTNSLIQVLLSFSNEINKVNVLTSHLLLKLFAILFIAISLFTVIPEVFDWMFDGRYNESIVFFQFLSLIHIVGLIFTPLEVVFLVKKPRIIFFLKIAQFLILILTPLLMIVSLWTILLGVLFSRLAAWLFLTYYYYDKKLIET
tara:strand:+ start:623 stop:1852 length:1230 start_codon:yes stop_codon:yes gene_type:complete